MALKATVLSLVAFACCASALKQTPIIASLNGGIKRAKVVYTDASLEAEPHSSLIELHQSPAAAKQGDNDVVSAKEIEVPSDYKVNRRPPNKTPEGTVLMKSRIDVFTCYGIDDVAELIKFASKITSFWVDARLVVDKAENTFTRIDADKVWHPQWSFLNTASVDQEMTTIKVNWSNGKVKMQYVSTQSISSEIDFAAFPFDSHDFKLAATAVRYGVTELHNKFLSPDDMVSAGEAAPSTAPLDGATWKVKGITTAVVQKPTIFSPKDELLQVAMHVERKRLNPIMCGCLPQLLIVLFQLGAFYVAPKEFGDRISITITGVFTIVLFFGIVDGYFPRISYLSWMHWYTFICNMLTFGVFGAVLYIEHIRNNSGEEDKAEGEVKDGERANEVIGWSFVATTVFLNILMIVVVYV